MTNDHSRLLSRGLLALALLGTACDVEPITDADEDTELRLSANSSTLWSQWDVRAIDVCWTNLAAVSSHDRAIVRDTMTSPRSWAHTSSVRFFGWGQCSGSPKGIRITGGTEMEVTQFPPFADMELDVTANLQTGWARCTTNGLDRDDCLAAMTLHEFGHALSFTHEHNRPDSTCNKPNAGTIGDDDFGQYDTGSILNYCSPATELSRGDVAGVNAFYGRRTPFGAMDSDGDGADDFVVTREGTTHWIWFFDDDHNGVTDDDFDYGLVTDLPVQEDYDGDGCDDAAVVRQDGNDLHWYIDTDHDGITEESFVYGKWNDVPVPGDFNGDGVADAAVVRVVESGGIDKWKWFVDTDLDGVTDLVKIFGQATGDPVPADYSGNGTTQPAVVLDRPNGGLKWQILSSIGSNSILSVNYGLVGDMPVVGDYDGDGAADLAVAREVGTKIRWYADTNLNGTSNLNVQFGNASDQPAPGDYDGDGTADLAVTRETGTSLTWYVDTNRNGTTDMSEQFGTAATDLVP